MHAFPGRQCPDNFRPAAAVTQHPLCFAHRMAGNHLF